MTGNNNLKPIENLKPAELVSEIKDEYKVPTFEEFMKTYKEDEKVSDSYEAEVKSYGDIRIKGTYYGPGFWDDIKGFVKPIASGALIAASVFPPTAAIAAPITVGVLGTGAAVAGIGHATDNEEWKDFGKDIIDIGTISHDGQGVTDQSGLNAYARTRN